MADDTLLPFSFPAVSRKKVAAAFDVRRASSRKAASYLRLRPSGRPTDSPSAIRDPPDPARVSHAMADILRARIFAIACGYEDANDLDRLRAIRPSSSPAGDCPTAARTCARSRPARGWRTCPTSGPSSGWAMRWSSCGSTAIRLRPKVSRSSTTRSRCRSRPSAAFAVQCSSAPPRAADPVKGDHHAHPDPR